METPVVQSDQVFYHYVNNNVASNSNEDFRKIRQDAEKIRQNAMNRKTFSKSVQAQQSGLIAGQKKRELKDLSIKSEVHIAHFSGAQEPVFQQLDRKEHVAHFQDIIGQNSAAVWQWNGNNPKVQEIVGSETLSGEISTRVQLSSWWTQCCPCFHPGDRH